MTANAYSALALPPMNINIAGEKDFVRLCKVNTMRLREINLATKANTSFFFNIDEQKTFLEDFADSSRKQVYHPYFEYMPNLHLLLIKMVTEAHEQAHEYLHHMIIRKFAFMNNLDLKLHLTGQAEKESNGRKKKANKSYRPQNLPDGRSNYWHSVLLEAAYPEESSKLASDARWWLIESAGDVKTVVTIAVHQTTKEITIETWD